MRMLLAAIGIVTIALSIGVALVLAGALRDVAADEGVASHRVYGAFGLAALFGLFVGVTFYSGLKFLLSSLAPDRTTCLLVELWDRQAKQSNP